MRSNAGMANRQGDVDLRFAQVSARSQNFGLASPDNLIYSQDDKDVSIIKISLKSLITTFFTRCTT
jgi:hypothetical protein